MKKTLIALAVLAASGAAFAQSSVTLSGVYSVSYQKDLTNTAANGNPLTNNSAVAVQNAAANAVGKGFAVTDANVKLAAVEDLGGGLKASFDTTFETGAQRGTMTTRADSGMGLSGAFGSVAVRNTRSSDLIASIGSAAISLPDGLYDNLGIVSRGGIDTLSYTSPTVNGFTGSLTAVEGVDGNVDVNLWNAALATPNSKNPKATVVGLGYAAGPLAVSAAFKSYSVGSTSPAKKNQTEIAVSYDLGVAKLFAQTNKTKIDGAKDIKGGLFGATAPVGAGTVRVAMSSTAQGDAKSNQFALGYVYSLSKRTDLYATYASVKNKGGAAVALNGSVTAANAKSTGYDFGVKHSF